MTAHSPSERARVRAQAGSAGQVLFSTWPIKTFVAVNPLGGVEHRPFEEAVALVGSLLGLRGHLPLATYRELHAAGRVTDADLDAALRRRVPELDEPAPIALDGRLVGAVEALRTDLLHGPDAPQPVGLPRGAGEWCDELLGTEVAPLVDEQVAKWCAAFCDTRRARWSMPARERGLYGAWRTLVADDPALRRARVDRERFARLPGRPEDALLGALAALRIPEVERRAELRAQLARLPGWASHVKWRAEHPDQAPHPADLVDLLAIRLSYEAALVNAAAAAALPNGTAGLRALIEQRLAAQCGAPNPRACRARAVAHVLGSPDPCEAALEQLAAVLERVPASDRGWVWLDAYEWHYRDRLLAALSRPAPPARAQRPATQAVFCIDARSEGLRRHLEARGPYETFGFAGFYQLVVRYRALCSTHEARLCPVPLTPTKAITERPIAGTEVDAARDIALERHANALVNAFRGAKDELASPFALAEAAGWVAGPLAAAKTTAPGSFSRVRARLAARAARRVTDPTVDTPNTRQAEELAAAAERQSIRALLGRPELSEHDCEAHRRRALDGAEPRLRDELDLTAEGHAERVTRALRLGYDPGEQVLWAEFALRSFGLVEGFARMVLLAGHGSRTENNAYEAALDCGACGGQHGGPNARISCAMLNRPAVRAGLAERGIHIPGDTVFVAGEHDTATDRVTIFDAHTIPSSHAAEVERLQADLGAAGVALARERHGRLPGRDHPQRRSGDWGQVRPEWGLARHAAFIVGPGSMVCGLDLETRTFLHSYDWRADPDATALETILTAPGLVIQWINAQYYFATVDPEVLGAGDKTLHNVVGDVGVLQGHAGDLQLGLPWQSVAAGDHLYHEPMRALYVVEAPRERVEMLIARNDLLKHYFDGAWVALALREGPGEPWQRRTTGGVWQPWRPATAPTTKEIAA